MGLTWRLRTIKNEFFAAWQRAWQGFDRSAVCDFNYEFPKYMTSILEQFQKDNVASWSDGSRILSSEETDATIQELILAFKRLDEDFVLSEMYGGKSFKQIMKERKISLADLSKEWEAKQRECQNEAFRLLNKWYGNLWI